MHRTSSIWKCPSVFCFWAQQNSLIWILKVFFTSDSIFILMPCRNPLYQLPKQNIQRKPENSINICSVTCISLVTMLSENDVFETDVLIVLHAWILSQRDWTDVNNCDDHYDLPVTRKLAEWHVASHFGNATHCRIWYSVLAKLRLKQWCALSITVISPFLSGLWHSSVSHWSWHYDDNLFQHLKQASPFLLRSLSLPPT